MQEFTTAMRQTFRFAFFFMAASVILWALLPEHRVFLQSIFAGMFANTINNAVLFSKAWKSTKPDSRPRGTGMLQRFVMVAFLAYLTVRFPEIFVISGALIGFFLIQVVSLLFVYRSFK